MLGSLNHDSILLPLHLPLPLRHRHRGLRRYISGVRLPLECPRPLFRLRGERCILLPRSPAHTDFLVEGFLCNAARPAPLDNILDVSSDRHEHPHRQISGVRGISNVLEHGTWFVTPLWMPKQGIVRVMNSVRMHSELNLDR